MAEINRFLFGKKSAPVTLAQSIETPGCTNCGTAINGPFCSECGQKKEHKHDVTLWHFFMHSLHEFTHLDSRFYKTVKYLISKPGYLVEEYIAGHKKQYINPVRLFIIVNLLYLLLTGVDTFTTPLETHVHDKFRNIVQPLVASKLKQTGLSFKEYAKQFDEKTKGQAEMLIVLMAFAFSVVMSLLYYRQRRYFLEHLIFSFNFYSVILLLLGIGMVAFYYSVGIVLYAVEKTKVMTGHITKAAANEQIQSVLNFIGSELFLELFVGLVVGAILFSALKRVYRESNFSTLIKTVVAYIGLWYIMLGYRLVLFFVTFYTLRIH